MTSALVGYTGFVGSNLVTQTGFDDLFNSKNIEEIAGKKYEVVVCAGAPAAKWKINQEPEKDKQNLNRLMAALEEVRTKHLILISTVDVYPKPIGGDEDFRFEPEEATPYGLHRWQLEKFCDDHFTTLIVRLPGLFGPGIKKNIIYDFLNDNNVDRIHSEGIFQFYDLGHLWQDINVAIKNDLRLVNFSTEPVCVKDVASVAFGIEFSNQTDYQPATYDCRSKYAHFFNGSRGYLYNKAEVLTDMKTFVRNYKG